MVVHFPQAVSHRNAIKGKKLSSEFPRDARRSLGEAARSVQESRCQRCGVKMRRKEGMKEIPSVPAEAGSLGARGYTAKEAITGLSLEEPRKSWGERTNERATKLEMDGGRCIQLTAARDTRIPEPLLRLASLVDRERTPRKIPDLRALGWRVIGSFLSRRCSLAGLGACRIRGAFERGRLGPRPTRMRWLRSFRFCFYFSAYQTGSKCP